MQKRRGRTRSVFGVAEAWTGSAAHRDDAGGRMAVVQRPRSAGSPALSPPRPGGPCARRMIPLESPVPEIGTPGSVSGGLETRPWEPD